MADSTVKVNFLGDASSLKRATDDADGHLGRIGASIGNMAKAAAIGFAAAGAGLALFAKSAISAAQESAKVTASTEAVIKSTGSAAHVTAKQVGELATAISNKTGIDDEAIQSGQNLLLTFTNLQNRVGKGNDIFNQASEIMVDMAAAMGTDASSTAIQLGKALNDPVKGISALTRVGVTFTAAQKKQIEAMVKAGDVAGAQKIILAELKTEFGGMAAAQATSAQKMKVAFGNLQEEIGGMLIPVVEKFSVALMKLMPTFQRWARALFDGVQVLVNAFRNPNAPWEDASPFVRGMAKVGQIFREVYGAFLAFVAAFKKGDGDITSSGFPGFMERVGNIARNVFDWLKVNVPPVLAAIRDGIKDLAGWVNDNLVPALGKMADSFRKDLWPAIEEKVIPALQKLAKWIRDEVLPQLGKIVTYIFTDLLPAFFKIAAWIIEDLIPTIAHITVVFWQFLIDVKDVADKIVEKFNAIGGPIAQPFIDAKRAVDDFVDSLDFIPDWAKGSLLDLEKKVPGPRIPWNKGLIDMINGKAGGGPVSGGRPYIVGESGPEVFVPGGSGSIVPNHALGGGGAQSIVLNIDGRSFMEWFVDYSRDAGGVPLTLRSAS